MTENQKSERIETFLNSAKTNFSLQLGNWPFWVGVGLMSIGLFFAITIKEPSLLEKLVVAGITEMGFAFFIAHIIIITVDREEKQEMRRELRIEQIRLENERRQSERRVTAKLYLSSVLEVDLPNNISAELNEYILASKLLKRDQRIRYTLKNLGSYAKLIQALDATYENVHKGTYHYEPPFLSYHNTIEEIEQKHPDEQWGLLSFHLSISRVGSDIVEELIEWRRGEGETSSVKQHNFNANLEGVMLTEPIPMEFGDKIRLQVEWLTPKFANDNEVFTNTNFSESMIIDMEYDKSKFEAGYRCIHPRAKECMHITKGQHQDTLKFKYPFLPSNGVVAWWRKITPQTKQSRKKK